MTANKIRQREKEFVCKEGALDPYSSFIICVCRYMH